MTDAIAILGAKRTPIGNFGGSLKDISSVELMNVVIKDALQQGKVLPEDVDETICGSIIQSGIGQNLARQAAMKVGIPDTSPAMTINKLCGSGLKAVQLAGYSLLYEGLEVVVAGGSENMSQAPYLLKKARFGYGMGHGEILDSLIHDGLTCAIGNYHMGITAENIAEQWAISRQEQDRFAVASQEKAVKAKFEGRFKEEITPVEIPLKRGETKLFCEDEYPKEGVTEEKLARLKPAFKKEGTVTAGNASGINDGAACVVLMKASQAEKMGLEPLALVKGVTFVGVDPAIMGIGPVPATEKLLTTMKLSVDAIDLFEANEAFAAQSLAVQKELKLDPDKVNVNGGAIALGHPVGASGARILVTLLYEMRRRKAKLGVATLCVGGGMGLSALVEIP